MAFAGNSFLDRADLDSVDLGVCEDFGGRAVGEDSEPPLPGSDGTVFSARPVPLDHFNIDSGHQRMVAVAAANCSVLAGFQNGEVVRWFSAEDETSVIDFGREKCGDVSRILLEPKGFHAIITNNAGDSWYLNFQSNQTKTLPKLHGHLVEAVSWDPDSTAASTKDLILGTMEGELLHVVLENKERVVKPLFVLEPRLPICGLHRERTVNVPDGGERVVLFVAAGCGIYGFIGSSIDTLFQRYSGDGAATRALIYEVPRDSPRGELHVDVACDCRSSSTATKTLFWLTGVGTLAADIRSPIEADNVLLESPPGLIPFPRSPKAAASVTSGSTLVASLLPPSPPPPPISMALTKYHIVFIFEDRWAVVSRITYELVQQQEWSAPTHGALRGLARDVHGEGLWMCSEKRMFEIVPENESRNVWLMLLRLERFDEAITFCRNRNQSVRVLAAHADWLFRKGRLVESAKKFAETTSYANMVSFEHVALRFIRADHKAALREYFRERFRLCPSSEKVTRSLLGVWAVEIALANLNYLKQAVNDAARSQTSKEKARSLVALDEARANLRELLHDCKELDVQTTIYHLLQSHGWLEELTHFAEERGDFDTVILHHVSRCDYVNAIKNLADFQATNANVGHLICRFAPVLFGAEPKAFVSLLLRKEFSNVYPLSVLPGLYTPRASPAHRLESVRYLEHAMRHFPGLVGHLADGEAGSYDRQRGAPSFDADLISAVGEPGEDGISAPTGRSWATGTAVLNALSVLYASDPGTYPGDEHEGDSAEDFLLRFFRAQEDNLLFDLQFALRVCRERGHMRAAVLLYGLMGMHEEAVGAALAVGDVDLAKNNACRPAERHFRQKLWLRIVEHQAETGDIQATTGLIRESQELTVRDVLPHMSDCITVDNFTPEINECLESYEGQIQSLRQEMNDHRLAMTVFKKDLKQLDARSVTISQDQVCEICGASASREQFYAFACKHCFHVACIRALVCPSLSVEKRTRLFALEAARSDQQPAVAAQANGAASTADDEIDSILADDCPLCGRVMIETLRRPFVDFPAEKAVADSWSLD